MFSSIDALSEVEGLRRNKIKVILMWALLRMFEVSVTLPQFDIVVVSLVTINIIQNKAVICSIEKKET